MKFKKSIFIALDGLTKEKALRLVKQLHTSSYAHVIAGFKVHDLWDRYGPGIVKDLKKAGAKIVWLDLKLHDTPKTTGLRAKMIKKSGADIVSVHASSGLHALREANKSKIKIVVITILTSLDTSEVMGIYGGSPEKAVLRLANIAKKVKLWGIVCSAQEVKTLSKEVGDSTKIIVPGIKIKKQKDFNQKRIGTPRETLISGASHIVVGSEITKSKTPIIIFEKIAKSL